MHTAPSPSGPTTPNAVHPLSEMSPNATPGLSRTGRLAWLLAAEDVVDVELGDGRRATLPVREIGTHVPDDPPNPAVDAASWLARHVVLGNAQELGGITSDRLTLSSQVAYGTHPRAMPTYRRAPIVTVEPVRATSIVDDRVATTGVDDLTLVQSGVPSRRRPAQLTLIGRHRKPQSNSDVIATLMRDGRVGIFPALAGTDDVPESEPLRTISLDTYRTELDAGVLIATDETTTAFNQIL